MELSPLGGLDPEVGLVPRALSPLARRVRVVVEQVGGEYLVVGSGGRDDARLDRPALGHVAVQQKGAAPAPKDGGEFPSEINGIANPRVQPVPAERGIEVGRVPGDEHSAVAPSVDELHAVDYLVYAYLQEGRDADAKKYVDLAASVKKLDNPNFAAAYAISAVPSRYALERRQWKEAAALTVPKTISFDSFPYAEANVHFGRAIGAARSGDLAIARDAVGQLEVLHQKLVDQKSAYWADQVAAGDGPSRGCAERDRSRSRHVSESQKRVVAARSGRGAEKVAALRARKNRRLKT
jgi:hypothetical protein